MALRTAWRPTVGRVPPWEDRALLLLLPLRKPKPPPPAQKLLLPSLAEAPCAAPLLLAEALPAAAAAAAELPLPLPLSLRASLPFFSLHRGAMAAFMTLASMKSQRPVPG